MDVLWHINLEEMLGDLTVATFLILMAASVVVVSSLVMFPLIDLAFEKKVEPPIPHHNKLTQHDPGWLARRPWLALRSGSDLSLNARIEQARLANLAGKFSEPHYRTPLIKRTPVTEVETIKLTGPSEAA